MDDDGDLSASEQIAFCEAHDLIKRLQERPDLNATDIGKGVLVAAVSCLRKVLSGEEIAHIFYEYADDYAARNLPDGSV